MGPWGGPGPPKWLRGHGDRFKIEEKYSKRGTPYVYLFCFVATFSICQFGTPITLSGVSLNNVNNEYLTELIKFFRLTIGSAWERLGAPGSTWERLGAPGNAWERLGTLGSPCERLGVRGGAWKSLGASENVVDRPGAPGNAWGRLERS